MTSDSCEVKVLVVVVVVMGKPGPELLEVDAARRISLCIPDKPSDEEISRISVDTTGTVVWGASRVLIDYFRRFDGPALAHIKNVLELGAGCGLLSAYLRVRLPESTIVSTDLEPNLPHLRNSLRLNESKPLLPLQIGSDVVSGSLKGKIVKVDVKKSLYQLCTLDGQRQWVPQHSVNRLLGTSIVAPLSWGGEPVVDIQRYAPYDLIVAADVTYKPENLRALFASLSQLSSASTGVAIAMGDRPLEAQRFEAEAQKQGWDYNCTLTHDLDVSLTDAATVQDAQLLEFARSAGGYRVHVYELRKQAGKKTPKQDHQIGQTVNPTITKSVHPPVQQKVTANPASGGSMRSDSGSDVTGREKICNILNDPIISCSKKGASVVVPTSVGHPASQEGLSVYLPGVTSSSQIDLDLSAKYLILSVPQKDNQEGVGESPYALELPLEPPVDPDLCVCHFKKASSRMLIIYQDLLRR